MRGRGARVLTEPVTNRSPPSGFTEAFMLECLAAVGTTTIRLDD